MSLIIYWNTQQGQTHTQAPGTDISYALRVNKHLYKRTLVFIKDFMHH